NVTIFNTYAERWASYTNRPSFTINELLSPEFIQNGALMVFIILGPLLLIDFSQHFIQKQLRKEQTD
ncbi:MAG: hypothetical protein KAU48_11960, partial [Candidatus Thorarchaeota archaeon]|nr:hypothetical protein [Candidatus Thorarchaeota archaeon]